MTSRPKRFIAGLLALAMLTAPTASHPADLNIEMQAMFNANYQIAYSLRDTYLGMRDEKALTRQAFTAALRAVLKANPDLVGVWAGFQPNAFDGNDQTGIGSGLRREDLYICNILKCRPPNNRTPEPDECVNCREYLDAQLAISPAWHRH